MFFTFAAAIGGLAQLVRALAWHARGREFESRILHHFLRVIVVFSGGYFHFNGIRFYALGKPTVFPFRRPERRSTAADVRPRTPRDPRSFSANRSSAQPTYNCRPHPLHLRLRIETADNLQRGTESPRSESYPKHVRSHDLPRPLPTLRAPQTTPPPDRIPPGSTALPQTVRGRSATIPPPAFATFPNRLLSPVSRTVPTSDSDAKRIPPLPPKTGSLPPHGVFPLPPQTAAPRRCCATPASAYAFAGQPTDGTRQGAQRPSLLSSSLPTKSAENPGISRPDPRICLRNRPEIGRTNGRRSENVPPPPARSAAELSTAVFGCPTLTRESDRPAAETTDFAGTAVIRAPDRPGPVAELARSIPATFRDRTEAYSHPSSPAPPEEPVPRAGHRTTHLRKTSAGTGPKTVHQSRFTRQPQSRPRKTARRTCSQSRTQPPQKSSPAPPAEPTKQIRNESVEHAASVQTKCVQAKGNAQKEMRKAKRNTPKRKATPQNASFRPAICRPETSANAAPGPCGGGGARRATPASSRRRCPYPYRWTAALRCGRRSPAVCRPVRAAFCPEARNSPRRGRPSSPAYCPAARSP